MKTKRRLRRFALFTCCACLAVAVSAQGVDFVVAPDGRDDNPGTEAKPFTTLARARDAVRALKKDGMKKDVIVDVRAGEYVLGEPVVFSPEDSGSDGFRVIYRNADALGSARFVGGKRATGWTRHEGKIWKKTGVKRLVTTLYEDGRRAHIARAPNRGVYPEYPNAMAPYSVSVGGSYYTLVYDEGDFDPTAWKLTDRAAVVWWTKGGKQDWGQHVAKLLSIDAEKRTLHVKGREHRLFNIASGDRFFVMNVHALLDAPGEFYHDTDQETLYYMPHGDDPNEANIRLPGPATLVTLNGKSAEEAVHDIVLSGLSFEQTNCGYLENRRLCGAVDLRYCGGIRIETCRFWNIGDFAVFGQVGVHHCTILNCRIEHTGQGGILIQNRSIKRIEQPNVRGEFNRVHNCLIHDLGEIVVLACHNGGVMLWNANDCRVSHCDIARNTRYGISLRGHYSSQRARDDGLDPDIGTHLSRNNAFQYIKIADVGTDSGDMGAIHAAHLNEPDGSCINTWRQIVVRGARAHPSMKDLAPNGIFVDHPFSCQKQVFMDVDISGTQGDPFRDNRNPVQTFLNVSWKPGFDRTRMETDRIGLTPEFPQEYGGQGAVDRTPPSPDAPQWADAGRALGDSAVRVEATPCKDDMTGVEYTFECLTEGGHDSGWQVMPVYTDRSLAPETAYGYRVRVRDTSCARNETQWSEALTVKTDKKSNAPTVAQSAGPCVARYRFEGDGQDATGDHHGKVSGNAAFSNDAREGKHALACGENVVTVPDHEDLDIGRGDFALSLWFLRRKDPQGNLRLLSKHDKTWRGYCVRGGDQSIGFDIGNGDTRPLVVAHTAETGKWQHLVVNVERGSGLVRLYLNGALVSMKDFSVLREDDIDSDAPLTIGSGSNLPWKGLVDDVRFYKRILTEAEIKALSLPVAQDGPRAAQDPRHIESGHRIPDEGYCDQPYVVELLDGTWLCTLTTGKGREGQRGQHVVATISKDRGKTWGPLIDIEPGDGPEASWVVPLIVPGGRVYAFYSYNGDKIDSIPGETKRRADMLGWYCYKYSEDNGKTWSKRYRIPIRVTAADRANQWEGQVQVFWGIDKPKVSEMGVTVAITKLGRWMLENGEGWLLHSDNILSESDPESINWRLLPDGDHGIRLKEFGSVQEEHNHVIIGDDRLYMVYRTTNGYPSHAYSEDGGRTWDKPRPMTYTPGGRTIRNPRANAKLWRCENGKYLFWFHLNGTKTFGKILEESVGSNRNPAWIAGGVVRDDKMHWSEPELLLYNDLEGRGMSYPDLIEQDGKYWVTETQKSDARIHEIDPTLLEGLWAQLEGDGRVAKDGLVLSLEKQESGADKVKMPRLPDLASGGGFAIDLWLQSGDLKEGQVILDSRDDKGCGVALEIADKRSVRLLFSDGKNKPAQWTSDPGLLTEGQLHHITAIVDGGPNIMSFLVDGKLCDGGDSREYGWGRFDPKVGDVNGTDSLMLLPSFRGKILRLRVYDRMLRTSEAVSNHQADEARAETDARVRQWRNDKFGMFIHWGLYSIPAGVWKGQPSRRPYAEHLQLTEKIPKAEYAKLADQFNPVKFDAGEWVRIAELAGMRHIVITAKHQDGFAMYDSDVSDFNIVDATPFARDPMKELADAAHRQGLGFGFYYSQARDHHHPLANWNKHGNTWNFPQASKDDFITYLDEKAKPQIQELLTGYGDLRVMWFDVPYNIPLEECGEIAEMVRARQPDCVVNSRLGGEVWDYRSLGDNEISDEPLDDAWETCMTMNDSWGYHQLDDNWKSAEQIIRHLVDIVSKGGCLLLNVGPTAEGLIPEPSVTRLKKIGEWLGTNGEAIYGTSATVIGRPEWGRCTVKGNRIYLHVFDWPENGEIAVPSAGLNVPKAYLLADKARTALKAERNGENVVISLPSEPPDPICTVIVLEK